MSFISARKKAGLTQAVAADKLGVSDASVCQWEKGVTMPNPRRLTEIARVYGCTVNELLAEDESEASGTEQ